MSFDAYSPVFLSADMFARLFIAYNAFAFSFSCHFDTPLDFFDMAFTFFASSTPATMATPC